MLKYRRQRPIRGGRAPLPSCVLNTIHEAVDRDARKYGVSRSWVIAVILARAYRIEEQESYETPKPKAPIVPLPVSARKPLRQARTH